MTAKRLNIGCGNDIKEGYVNLDICRLPGLDVVHDVTALPLPFGDGEFDEVLCQDVLEHFEYIPVLKDIHRVLKAGGVLEIRVPHFTSKNNFIDPTHKKMFSIETFDFFVKDPQYGRGYYFDFCFEKVICSKITFDDKRIFHRWVGSLINRRNKRKKYYESTFLSRVFPAVNIEIKLLK